MIAPVRLLVVLCFLATPAVVAAQQPEKGPPSKSDAEPKVPSKEYAKTFFQSLKGVDRPEGWRYASQAAENLVQFEKAGLRITIPAGSPKGQTASIFTDFGVKGDFEITLSFEALKDPAPEDVGKAGTRLSLVAVLDTPLLDTPKQEVATLNRSMSTQGFLAWVRNRHDAAPLSQGFPIPATSGRLRLVRSGEDLNYLASVGTDQPFLFLTKYRFGPEDVKRVAITASTGGDKASLDVRLTDFRIRADAIPDAPPSEPESAAPQQPVAAPPAGGKGWLVAAAFVLAAVVGLLAAGFFMRRRGSATTPAVVSFSCPECAKALRVAPGLAGKKVKCPTCGAVATVPHEAGEARDASS